jgi:hypothetical protein
MQEEKRMDLILNGSAQSIDASNCANLAELVAAAERSSSSEEESVVVGVEIDGEPLSPEALSALESHSLAGVTTVSIQRRSTLAVARSVLEQGADYTGQIATAIGQTVDHYRSGRSDLANSLLANVTDSLTVLTGITYSVSNVLVEEAKSLAALQGELFPWLEEMIQAQTSEDPILIADILEYEIAPRVAGWGQAMRAIRDETGTATTAGSSASTGISN